MSIDKNQRRAQFSWLFVGALFVLCGVLGVLQYRWLGEVSLAERDRLRTSLQASLDRLSRDFNSEITEDCRALIPADAQLDTQAPEAPFAALYEQWRKTTRHRQIFRAIAVAWPQNDTLRLRSLDLERGVFHTAQWPAPWSSLEKRLEARLSPGPWPNRRPPAPPDQSGGYVFEIPIFAAAPRGAPSGPFGRREYAWVIFDLDPRYVGDSLLPELLQRYLGTGGPLDYQVEVLTKTNPSSVIYRSDPRAQRVASGADASVTLFEPQYDQIFRRRGPPGSASPPPGPALRQGPDFGRWQMFVRHRAGSLEAVVARTRWRNLAVTMGVLLLMFASAAALMRFTRRAQKLAELQMDFVAGVSHELRTPLTVIHTAAYNLRGKLAHNPAQVERYGELIQRESGRLKDLVEQVLRFAGAEAGRIIQEPQPLSVETVIADTMEASKAAIQVAQCVVEKTIDPGLPLIMADPTALKHALENLLSNAAKYGTGGSNWIGVFASRVNDSEQPAVEIRVVDRGPGIPEDEQRHIFDPFFRGRRAVEDQVHGTGLGLNLVKKIVEAHGGSIRVQSEPGKGTEFVIRIPAAPPELQHEFAHSLD